MHLARSQCIGMLATDRERIVTPYHAEAWETALRDCNLLHRYPNLVHDILYGSPIGNPPDPTYTYTPPNMASTEHNPAFIDDYLAQEVAAGRMSGPLTMEEATIFFGGHFRTAPLGLVEKTPGSGKWRMVQNNSALDENGFSTNAWLDAKETAIGWHTCAMMADMVSFSSSRMMYVCSHVCTARFRQRGLADEESVDARGREEDRSRLGGRSKETWCNCCDRGRR